MLERSRLIRLGWLLAAAFQLVLPTFASVADARAEVEASRSAARTHVEAYGTKGCPRGHPADCVVCRVLAMGATPASRPALQIPVARFIESRPADAERAACAARAPGNPQQRAPPV